jgi:cation:H+ antiporter
VIAEWISDRLGGQGPLLPLTAFLLTGVCVYVVASRLARHADAIADATGIGRLWIGSLLLAASTSLPELVTDVNAALLDAPDIGVGDLFGSTLANMLLLAVLDLSYRRRRLLQAVSPQLASIGLLAIVLTAVAGSAIASGGWGSIGRVGVETLAIVALYLVGMHAIYQDSMPTAPPQQLELGDTARTVLQRGAIGFALALAGLLLLTPLLVLSAHVLASESGLGDTFVGTMLVGATTSFPELAATVAAVRIGALDLAVGNLLGSNAFNMCVLLAMDLAYAHGPVLRHVSPTHLITAHFAVLSIGLGMIGILARGSRRLAPFRIVALLIICSYALAAWLLSTAGR